MTEMRLTAVSVGWYSCFAFHPQFVMIDTMNGE
jgi:hypothetical protein